MSKFNSYNDQDLYKVNPALRTEIDLFAKDLLTDCMIDFYRRYLDLDGKPIEEQVESYVQELTRRPIRG